MKKAIVFRTREMDTLDLRRRQKISTKVGISTNFMLYKGLFSVILL